MSGLLYSVPYRLDEKFTVEMRVGYRPNQSRILGLHQLGCRKRTIVIHELLHVLGMQHMHQCNDRNEHVEVYRDNIITNYLDQYDMRFSEYYSLPYELESVMHYDVWAFVKKGSDHTMRPREIKDASGARTTSSTIAKRKRTSRGSIGSMNAPAITWVITCPAPQCPM
ncbi:low choriolytic enzyme-like [Penaeus monodon]|uniref:low choriolytic enzyme-like n=1 Tax=Penaeus monodon TaxID=6687 RepID=UPI0018A72B1F|nr:low choriolytic enzyme-like [Penaeus monodon]